MQLLNDSRPLAVHWRARGNQDRLLKGMSIDSIYAAGELGIEPQMQPLEEEEFHGARDTHFTHVLQAASFQGGHVGVTVLPLLYSRVGVLQDLPKIWWGKCTLSVTTCKVPSHPRVKIHGSGAGGLSRPFRTLFFPPSPFHLFPPRPHLYSSSSPSPFILLPLLPSFLPPLFARFCLSLSAVRHPDSQLPADCPFDAPAVADPMRSSQYRCEIASHLNR